MLHTRREIADLLRRAEGNRKKTQEILRQLESLRGYIDTILHSNQTAPKREERGNTYNRTSGSSRSSAS